MRHPRPPLEGFTRTSPTTIATGTVADGLPLAISRTLLICARLEAGRRSVSLRPPGQEGVANVHAGAFRGDAGRGDAPVDSRAPTRRAGDARLVRTQRQSYPARDRLRARAIGNAPGPRGPGQSRVARLLPRHRGADGVPGAAGVHQ